MVIRKSKKNLTGGAIATTTIEKCVNGKERDTQRIKQNKKCSKKGKAICRMCTCRHIY